MPLGYKYVERDATNYVDWGAIGKNMTDMLQTEYKIREDKKKAIDDASIELGKTLDAAPQGDHKGMNQWALEFASDGQQARLLQDRLLKSGHLKLKDYTVQRQNLNDGTDQAFNLTKEYQDEYKTTMDGYQKGELQDLNTFLMASVEGFNNFSQTKLVINPKDGSVSVGKMKKNTTTGAMEMSSDPNDFATVNSLRNRMKQKYAKFNVEDNVKGYVDGLGIELNSIARLGGIHNFGTTSEILDITKRKNLPKNEQGIIMKFEEAETKALKARLATPYDVSSVLTNNIKIAPNGEPYTYTWDEKESKSNDNLILLKTDPDSGNPTPQFSEKQSTAALEHLRLQARLMYDKKQTIKQEDQLARNDVPQAVRDANDAEKKADNAAKAIGTLWGGKSGADVARATSTFRDMNPNVKKVTRTPTGVTVELVLDNGKRESRNLPFYGSDGKLMDQKQFIQSAAPLLGGGVDVNSAVQKGGYIKNATFNEMANETSEATDITPTRSKAAAGGKVPFTPFQIGSNPNNIPNLPQQGGLDYSNK